jgi:AraC-like DNA-binding protein
MGATQRIDEAEALTARAFQPHHFEPRSRTVDYRINLAPLGSSALSVVAFGVGASLDCPEIEEFYVEHFLTRGAAEIIQDDRAAICGSSRGVVMSPSTLAKLRLSPDCATVGFRVDRDTLESHFERLTGRPPRSTIVFENRVDLTRGSGTRRHQIVRWALAEAERSRSLGDSPLAATLEDAYIHALLTGHPHSHRSLLDMGAPDSGLAAVRRVEDYIHAHPEQPIRSESLVALSGVSTSSLYEAFQRERAMSPMRMLRDVRLARVRQDLLRAEPGESVTTAALRWGFTHLARFSGLYRRQFGELPSETLLLARRAS